MAPTKLTSALLILPLAAVIGALYGAVTTALSASVQPGLIVYGVIFGGVFGTFIGMSAAASGSIAVLKRWPTGATSLCAGGGAAIAWTVVAWWSVSMTTSELGSEFWWVAASATVAVVAFVWITQNKSRDQQRGFRVS